MYAVVEIAGRQFKVAPHDTIDVPRLQEKPGSTVTWNRVLLLGDEKTILVGNPLVTGARVAGTVIGHGKGQKVVVFKKKRRKGYRVKRGHRQNHTTIEITSIAR